MNRYASGSGTLCLSWVGRLYVIDEFGGVSVSRPLNGVLGRDVLQNVSMRSITSGGGGGARTPAQRDLAARLYIQDIQDLPQLRRICRGNRRGAPHRIALLQRTRGHTGVNVRSVNSDYRTIARSSRVVCRSTSRIPVPIVGKF